MLTNAQVLAGQGTSKAAIAYRELRATHSQNALCDLYRLDRDEVDGGTHWTDIIRQAVGHGDIDEDGNLT